MLFCVLILGNCVLTAKVHKGPHPGTFCPVMNSHFQASQRSTDSGQRQVVDQDIRASCRPVTQASLRNCELPSGLERRRTLGFHFKKIDPQLEAFTAIKLSLAKCFWTYRCKELKNCMCDIMNNRKQNVRAHKTTTQISLCPP